MAGSKFPVFPALLIPVVGFVLSGCGGGGGGSSGFDDLSTPPPPPPPQDQNRLESLGDLPIDGIASATFLGRLGLAQRTTPFTEGNQPGGASGDIGEDTVDGTETFTASGEIILGIEDTSPLVGSSLQVTQTPPADPTQEEPDAVILFTPGEGEDSYPEIRFTQYARLGDDDEGEEGDGPDGADPEAHINLIGNDNLSNIGVIVDLEHQAFGVWVRDFGSSSEPGAANFSDSPPSDVSNFPSGTATYEGGALGVLREGQSRHLTAAELNAEVNFGTDTYEINTSNTHRVELREGAEAVLERRLDFTARGEVDDAALQSSVGDDEQGNVAGSNGEFTGLLQGKLLGTDAEEIGGIFRLDNEQGAIYTGSFGARRTTETTP